MSTNYESSSFGSYSFSETNGSVKWSLKIKALIQSSEVLMELGGALKVN
jgi:hypothetical protein